MRNILNHEEITAHLKHDGVCLELFDTIDSTNLYLKQKDIDTTPEFTVVIAKSQTAGRGRFQRKFHSPKNSGIYMSILLKPDIEISKSVQLTALTAVAVCEACETLSGKQTKIKWVNDILLSGKKLCGILCESSVDSKGKCARAVLGIGINAYEPQGGFDQSIKGIAGALWQEGEGDINRLAAEIINNVIKHYKVMETKTFLEEYRNRSVVLGNFIKVMNTPEGTVGMALEIDDDCRLLVEYENCQREYISSGEISIKI